MKAFIRAEIFVQFRNRTSIFWTFMYPFIFFLVLQAILTGNIADSLVESQIYFFAGVAILTVISSCLFGVSVVICNHKAARKLDQFRVAPVSSQSFFLSFMVSRLFVIIVFAAVFYLIVFGWYIDGPEMSVVSFLSYMAIILSVSIFFIGVSFVVTLFAHNADSAIATVNIINIPVLFLSDLFIPIDLMPAAVKRVAEFMPQYIGANEIRPLLFDPGYQVNWLVVLGILVAGLLLVVLSARRFRWA